MTTSILNDILLLREETDAKIPEYLTSIGLNIFDPIYHNSQNIKEANQKVLYILTAYSEDSPLVILRQGAKEEKEGICEYLQIPEYMRENLTNLQEKEVRKAATQYMDQFAGQDFKTLMFLKIQLNDLERDITNREFMSKKELGKDEKDHPIYNFYWDIKEQGRATAEYQRISKAISALEKEMKTKGTYKMLTEMKEWREGSGITKKQRSGNVEAKIS